MLSTSDSSVPPAASIPVLLVLAGPAGSGKTTLCDRFVAEMPGFSRVVTATTRAPRPGEVNGVHYHFFSPEEFEAKIARDEFLEWAWVHGIDRYGTLKVSLLDPLAAGRSLIMNVDVQGVGNFRKAATGNPLLARSLTTVFISVSLAELRARMIRRGQNTEADIERRLETASKEIQKISLFDFVIQSQTKCDDFKRMVEIWHAAQRKAADVG